MAVLATSMLCVACENNQGLTQPNLDARIDATATDTALTDSSVSDAPNVFDTGHSDAAPDANLTDAASFDANFGDATSGQCANNDNCAATHYCAVSTCSASAGTCTMRPQNCSDPTAEVCGCNNRTYNNSCEAAADGTSVASTGRCPDCRTLGCLNGGTCMLCFASWQCVPRGAIC